MIASHSYPWWLPATNGSEPLPAINNPDNEPLPATCNHDNETLQATNGSLLFPAI